MKELAIKLLAGPVMMGLACVLGMLGGYHVGVIASLIAVAIATIGLGVLLSKRLRIHGLVPVFAVLCSLLTGWAGAHAYHAIRELQTGAFVANAAFADLPSLRDKDRLTFRDARAREDLADLDEERSVSGAGSTRQVQTSVCQAYPIVAAGWTRSMPVRAWRFGDPDEAQGRPIGDHVFHPGSPDQLCRKTIADATKRYSLQSAPDAVYLEAMTNDSANPDADRLAGVYAVALLGGLWIVIVLYLAARDAIGDRRRRRRARKLS